MKLNLTKKQWKHIVSALEEVERNGFEDDVKWHMDVLLITYIEKELEWREGRI